MIKNWDLIPKYNCIENNVYPLGHFCHYKCQPKFVINLPEFKKIGLHKSYLSKNENILTCKNNIMKDVFDNIITCEKCLIYTI